VQKPCPQWQQRQGALALPARKGLSYLLNSQGIPVVNMGNFTLQDMTSRTMVLAINAVRIAQAVGHHFFETLGRDGLNNVFQWTLLSMVKGDSFSINTWLLNGLMQPKAFVRPVVVGSSRPNRHRLKAWWQNHYMQPIQSRWGLDGCPQAELFNVLRFPTKDQNWARWKPTDNLIGVIHQWSDTLHLHPLFKGIEGALEQAEQQQLSVEATQALVRTQGLVAFKRMGQPLLPKQTIEPLMIETIKTLYDAKGQLRNDHGKDVPYVCHKLSFYLDKYRSIDEQHPELYQASALRAEQFVNALITQPSGAGLPNSMSPQQKAVLATEEWMQQLNTDWYTRALVADGHALDQIEGAVAQAYAQWHAQPSAQRGSLAQHFAKHQAPLLLHNKGSQLGGSLATVLNPVYQLSERHAMVQQFLSHRNTALLAQAATQAAITCLVLGNLLLFIVFNTFARLDPDFVPPEGSKARPLTVKDVKEALLFWQPKTKQAPAAPPDIRVSLELKKPLLPNGSAAVKEVG
jgi:hypothetical protein